jgi:radical S-adenosyl methionine domain-containing protein 2
MWQQQQLRARPSGGGGARACRATTPRRACMAPVCAAPPPRALPPSVFKVNYHFTRRCNFGCGFCFHTASSSHVLPLADAQRGLALLADAGMRAVNFAGGEPFLEAGGLHVGELARFCKRTLRLPFVSVITNGSLVTQDWLGRYGDCLDVLGVSCDSFHEPTNVALGRRALRHGGGGDDGVPHAERVARLAAWCRAARLPLKLNTVVTAQNAGEDMRAHVAALGLGRWKLFQCLLLDGENAGAGALRRGAAFTVADDAFAAFVARHVTEDGLLRAAQASAASQPAVRVAVEDNTAMQSSYLVLDERMRFLNCAAGSKQPGPSLLDVGVAAAVRSAGFDEGAFLARGGDWALPQGELLE